MNSQSIDSYITDSRASTTQTNVICPSCNNIWKATLFNEYGASEYMDDQNVCKDCNTTAVDLFELGELTKSLQKHEDKELMAEKAIRKLTKRQLRAKIKTVQSLTSKLIRSIKENEKLDSITLGFRLDWVRMAMARLQDIEEAEHGYS
jgi:predicted nucleic acid-binding protein